ncbi:uncharacterized protein TNCT_703621 [Trichonephila clavata]|uniref:Osteopetrosis-associated transmembrane protein 1 n=1 Tax=Trichonephila clavata TaxID=2740835 RepID=A0A8X6LBN2_TRICU|nr:uncharacterized protein TNCT_703621 [Trichonephila clavata]
MFTHLVHLLILSLTILPTILTIDHSLIGTFHPKITEKPESLLEIGNVPLENSNSSSDSEVTTEQSLTISENCSLAVDHFSKAAVNFTKCAIKNARPVHVCMNCGDAHKKLVRAYKTLKKQSKQCQSFYFDSDQLGVVNIIYNNGNDMWIKSFCQNCYDYYNETERFFQSSNELVMCIENTNRTSQVAANSTCQKCHSAYVNLSESYNKFVGWKKAYVGGICMDIVDTMNISRRMWKEYDCSVEFDITIGFPNILTALTVGSTPLMFYLLAKNVSRLEDVKLVRPKRKFTMPHTPPDTENEE